MQGLDLFEDQDDGTIFRDVIMLTLLGFVAIVVILLPHLNPPVQAAASPSAGNMIIQVTWPSDRNTDIDLWVRAPNDKAVGYSAKGSKIFNLLRDDLGNNSSNDNSNYEFAFSRGAPAGEYVVNLHLYADKSGQLPIEAVVDVNLKGDGKEGLTSIASKKVTLSVIGEETTVLRFKLDEEGKLIPGSIHTLPVSLRNSSGASTTRL